MESIIFETMQSYNEYLEKLKVNILPLAEKFRGESVTEALNEVPFLFEGIEWIATINKKLNDLNYRNELDINHLNTILNELERAFENKDYNLCADILEYEILSTVNKLKVYELIEN
ncbi:hypothetical protein ACIQ4I_07665 [Rummeliibacillus sp. NPDC094406]|uniref:hypothetical protein n=1 Tax=Rummeliibacillus sp. NPDC094406 TaxID=3364511 RepID=UPI0037F566B3